MHQQGISLNSKRVLITGAAGFIGSGLACELLKTIDNIHIIGIDNMNDYYDVWLKQYRLKKTEEICKRVSGTFEFIKGDISLRKDVDDLFDKYQPEIVINLAAQAGVRYSITNPDAYMESNIIGFYNILEACRHSRDNGRSGVQHLVYASSSSVYGGNKSVPYCIKDKTDNPVSLYAATKKSNELLAYVYSHLYDIPSTGLRFFTVYGPAGRPDMAYFSFTNRLVKGETIEIYNYGNCRRDFTYIDDVVEAIKAIIQAIPEENENGVRYKLYNIGNRKPVNMMEFVDTLYQELVRAGVLPKDFDIGMHKKLVPMQPGDVEVTYANIDELIQDFGIEPKTNIRDGLRNFAQWYKDVYIKYKHIAANI